MCRRRQTARQLRAVKTKPMSVEVALPNASQKRHSVKRATLMELGAQVSDVGELKGRPGNGVIGSAQARMASRLVCPRTSDSRSKE